MNQNLFPLRHPGTFVRKNIIPPGMTVTEASNRLGIGRPALSNFLNGHSALSPEMAVRLEKAFDANRQRLLDMQLAYDMQERQISERGIAVHAFVPRFLTIKARQIENWADKQINARTHLPVLLRKLVHSTGNVLIEVNFPSYDNAQRQGNDGFVEASSATPWVPYGHSYWEFSTNSNQCKKANDDYSARLKSVDRTKRAVSTFIFVTPRNWSKKTIWEKEKNEAGDWKSVRAYDASDLEQWLEQSVPAQIWLAEQIGLPVNGYETLEQAWTRWANASEPHLPPELFAPAITAYQHKFERWLTKPSTRHFVIKANSRDEALAFLACLFDPKKLRKFKDLTAIFTSTATLKTLIASKMEFIPIVVSEDVERELGDAYRRLHCIVFHHHNAVKNDDEVVLDCLGHDTFEKVLRNSGFAKNDIDRLASESGRSLTILRRRLSKNPAIRTPVWAGDNDTAKALVPMALIGAWDGEPARRELDREIMANVADRKYKTIESDFCDLLQLDDSPVWSVERFRGVVSKIDALFAIARMITPEDLDRFFLAAEIVLSKTDPALDLPEEQRWVAGLYGKTRDHSRALCEGICETLVILSIYDDNLFQSRHGSDTKNRVAALIRKLLTPLSLENLLSQDHNLPYYAEAAPNEFLKIIECDLNQDDPTVFSILKPVDSSAIFASLPRTGLLWSLECLAWNPRNIQRVCKILAQLSRSKIDDNWTNKPDASLQAIFRSWVPQTAASIEQRVQALKTLVKNFSHVVWEICIEQIKPPPRFGHYSYRPLWRSDASCAGQIVMRKERNDFIQAVISIMIDWSSHDELTLGDLVEALESIPEVEQIRIWDLIDEWSHSATDSAKATLRERIRQFALTRRARHLKIGETTRNSARETYEKLQPQNPIARHGWLFTKHWVEETVGVNEADSTDRRKREEQIDRLRSEAMNDIWTKHGFEGIMEMLTASDAARIIGHYAMSCITSIEMRVQFIQCCLSLDENYRNKAELCLKGALSAIENNLHTPVLKAAAKEMSSEKRMRLFVNAPFHKSTWQLLDDYGSDIRDGYWKQVYPYWDRHTPTEFDELIDCLLDAGRPHVAFQVVHINFEDAETSRLKRLLHDVATVNTEPASHFKIDRHRVSEALESLGNRADVSCNDMAELEFLYIDVLTDSKYGIPNLGGIIAESPKLFAKAVALAYRRRDENVDPPEWTTESREQGNSVALAAYQLLDQLEIIPGKDENDNIDAVALAKWIDDVRFLCREYARIEMGDYSLGQLLAKAPKDEDGSWPCKAVCEAMEGIASLEIGNGFLIGVHNSRCACWRGEGGQQERDLSTKYRDWADRLHFEYPYVSGVLEDIAVSYDDESKQHDSEAEIAKRLRN